MYPLFLRLRGTNNLIRTALQVQRDGRGQHQVHVCCCGEYISRVRNICDKSFEFLFTYWLRPTYTSPKMQYVPKFHPTCHRLSGAYTYLHKPFSPFVNLAGNTKSREEFSLTKITQVKDKCKKHGPVPPEMEYTRAHFWQLPI